MGFDAFISYRRSDLAFAEGIYELCSSFGLRVFLDRRSLKAGGKWEVQLLEALRASRTLLVLWSRSAASSSYMQREWRLVPASCTVVPIKLDGSPLPEDLAEFQGLEGFGIAGRLVSRTLELTREQKLSRAEANERLLDELKADGIELEPRQRRALGGLVAVATGGWVLYAATVRHALADAAGALLSAKGAALLAAAGVIFGGGFLSAESRAAGSALPPTPPSIAAAVERDKAELDACRAAAPPPSPVSPSAAPCPPPPVCPPPPDRPVVPSGPAPSACENQRALISELQQGLDSANQQGLKCENELAGLKQELSKLTSALKVCEAERGKGEEPPKKPTSPATTITSVNPNSPALKLEPATPASDLR